VLSSDLELHVVAVFDPANHRLGCGWGWGYSDRPTSAVFTSDASVDPKAVPLKGADSIVRLKD
jgi:hypothetical protein